MASQHFLSSNAWYTSVFLKELCYAVKVKVLFLQATENKTRTKTTK